MEFTDNRILKTETGAHLNLNVMEPRGQPARAVVQINHGLAEHSGRFARFADFLAQKGFASYAHDHRGHGYTKAPDAPIGSFGKGKASQKVIADVVAVHGLIAKERPGIPVIIFGHSMGGLITLNFMHQNSHRVSGAAVWNSNFSDGFLGKMVKFILAWESFRLGSDVPSRILPKLTFAAWAKIITDERTAFDWLSRDTDEVYKYIIDPLCGWNANINLWQGVFDFIINGANEARLAKVSRDMPFNFVGGEKDPATDFAKATRNLYARMEKFGFKDITLNIYPETRHESLNELNRDIIMDEFATWADRVIASSRNR